MANAVEETILWFGVLTGIEEVVNSGLPLIMAAVALASLLLCFLGFRIYPAVFSGIVFFLTAAVFCLLWKERYSWLYVSAGFCVVGAVLAFLGFRCKNMGAVLLCGLESAMLAAIMWGNPLIAAAAGTLGGILTFCFPFAGVVTYQALCGGLLCLDITCRLFEITLPVSRLWCLENAALIAAGLAVQIIMNRNQKLFEQTYPKWLRKKEKKQ